MSAPEKVDFDNFANVETSHYFTEQLAKAPLNQYFHVREPVNVENQVIIRSNVDLLYSYAVVDVTEEATISLAPSEEYQIAQIIDENHYVPMVAYPGETITVRNSDLSTGNHVYVFGRTAISGGVDRAHELQDLRSIDAATANPYQPHSYDQDSLVEMRKQIEARANEADYSKGFGTPETTTPLQHTLAAELGWGGLPPQHAQYFQGQAVSTGRDAWSFDVPPLDYDHNGYFSVIKYTADGWLDVAKPGMSDSDIARNDDGTITIWFGDERCEGKPNVIETAEGQTFWYGIRLYRPLDVAETVNYIQNVRANPIRPA